MTLRVTLPCGDGLDQAALVRIDEEQLAPLAATRQADTGDAGPLVVRADPSDDVFLRSSALARVEHTAVQPHRQRHRGRLDFGDGVAVATGQHSGEFGVGQGDGGRDHSGILRFRVVLCERRCSSHSSSGCPRHFGLACVSDAVVSAASLTLIKRVS